MREGGRSSDRVGCSACKCVDPVRGRAVEVGRDNQCLARLEEELFGLSLGWGRVLCNLHRTLVTKHGRAAAPRGGCETGGPVKHQFQSRSCALHGTAVPASAWQPSLQGYRVHGEASGCQLHGLEGRGDFEGPCDLVCVCVCRAALWDEEVVAEQGPPCGTMGCGASTDRKDGQDKTGKEDSASGDSSMHQRVR